MCELGVFPNVLENDLLKVDKVLGLTFLRRENTSKDSKPRFIFTVAEFCAQWITTPVHSRKIRRFVNSAYPNKNNLAQKSKFIYDKQ